MKRLTAIHTMISPFVAGTLKRPKKPKIEHIEKVVTEQKILNFPSLSEEEIKEMTDRTNKKCIFHADRFVGNDLAVDQLCTVLFSSLEHEDRTFGIGPVFFDSAPSSGKTYAAKLLAAATGLPLLELDSNLVKSTDDIAEIAHKICEDANLKLASIGQRNGLPLYYFPPMIFFFDEFHTIGNQFANGLLRAMEKSDNVLTTKSGMYDCSRVLWIVSTTHIGKIYNKNPALLTRFNPIVKLMPPTEDEVAQIVRIQRDCKNWTIEESQYLVDWFGLIVREVMAKAREVNTKMRHKDCPRMEAIELVAKQSGIEFGGLKRDDVDVLKFLANQYPNRSTYADIESGTNIQYDTLKGMVMPALTTSKAGRVSYVRRRNFTITVAGGRFLLDKGLIDEKKYDFIKTHQV